MKRPPSTSPEFPPPQPQPPNSRDRKTRELPKLCDCHCCNRRINSTNPKNKIGILRSEWRIVLLCKSCHNLVESSQICSYCLTRVSSVFYECKKCRRRIHKDCASKFSFGESGNCSEEFNACFDCWIPNLLENEYNRNRIARSGCSRKQLGKNGVDKGKCLVDVGNEANVVAEERVAMAVELKENAFRKIMAAKKAVELASGAICLVSVDNGGDKGDSVVDDDARMAIRLHREMNSSPRISRNSCSLNSHCVDVSRVNGFETERVNETSISGNATEVGVDVQVQDRNGSSGVKQDCANKSRSDIESRGVNETSFSGSRTEIRVDVNGMNMNLLQVRDGNEMSGVQKDKKCNGDSKSCLITYMRKGKVSKIVKRKEVDGSLLKMYSRRLSRLVKPESSQCPPQIVTLERQCSKTYSRRRLHSKNNLGNSTIKLDNVDLTPDEEPRPLTNGT